MNKFTRISVNSTAEAALRKLKKAKIAVFDANKDGARFIFSVKDKDIKKVFAIFSNACYNVKTVEYSSKLKLQKFALLRCGLIAGALLFVIIAALANTFIFKIEVDGSGKYLESEVRRIIYAEGAGEFKPYALFDKTVATGKILALPSVTFCNIERRGSVLIVDVRTDGDMTEHISAAPLKSDVNGVLKNLVTICGTPARTVGESVGIGDVLIYAHTTSGETTVESVAVGYAEIECKKTYEYFAEAESEENRRKAYASTLIDENDIISSSHSVKPTSDGIIYVIEITYLHKLSINLN